MKKRKSTMTAGELIAKTAACPAYRARTAARDMEINARFAESRVASRPILEEIAELGVRCAELWDLIDSDQDLTAIVPVLLKHLAARDLPVKVREAMARALRNPAAASSWDAIVELFVEERDEVVKAALAASLARLASSERAAELLELAEDRSNGLSRVLFLRRLKRLLPKRWPALSRTLRKDPDLSREIAAMEKG